MRRTMKGQRDALVLFLVLPICFFCTARAAANNMEYEYRQAQSTYERLLKSAKKQKYRDNWLNCISKFKAVYTAQPSGVWADDAIFMVGHLYSGLYKYSFSQKDKIEALDYYNRLLNRFPKSPHRSKATKAIARLNGGEQDGHKKLASKPIPVKKGVTKTRREREIANGPSKNNQEKSPETTLAEVTDLRVWSSTDYTRVVVDVDQEVAYTYRLLKKDPSIGKPQRLYIDVTPARLGKGVKPVVPR